MSKEIRRSHLFNELRIDSPASFVHEAFSLNKEFIPFTFAGNQK
jgi:hypothetical protein